MATYVIGDVQGCFDELTALLAQINFDHTRDRLWFAGDLVNRGPKSLETLRFIKQLPEETIVVLGNHDLHLLSVAAGHSKLYPDDTLDDILAAPDREALLDWLRQRPLLHFDAEQNVLLVHAGVAPQWDLSTAQACAKEVETLLRGDDYTDNISTLFPEIIGPWDEALTRDQRLGLITHYLTRIRLCDIDGKILVEDALSIHENAYPWYRCPSRVLQDVSVVFGHWAALGTTADTPPNIYHVDTGCVWGGSLTALRLEDRQRFNVGCPAYADAQASQLAKQKAAAK